MIRSQVEVVLILTLESDRVVTLAVAESALRQTATAKDLGQLACFGLNDLKQRWLGGDRLKTVRLSYFYRLDLSIHSNFVRLRFLHKTGYRYVITGSTGGLGGCSRRYPVSWLVGRDRRNEHVGLIGNIFTVLTLLAK